MERRSISLFLAISLALVSACAHAPGSGAIRIGDSVRFAANDGREVFRIEPTRRGLRVEDGGGRPLVTLSLRGEALAIMDRSGEVVALVVPPSGERRGYQVLSADGREGLYSLRAEPDGDLSVFDAAEARVYKAKRRDYGFKVIDGEGRVESKVRVRPDKISMRDESGVTYLSTRDDFPASAAVALSLERLPFEYAVGLSVALAHWAPGEE